jgi:hypothetical protein
MVEQQQDVLVLLVLLLVLLVVRVVLVEMVVRHLVTVLLALL